MERPESQLLTLSQQGEGVSRRARMVPQLVAIRPMPLVQCGHHRLPEMTSPKHPHGSSNVTVPVKHPLRCQMG